MHLDQLTVGRLKTLARPIIIPLFIAYKSSVILFNIVQNSITMPDTNMDTAYSWANKLADLSHLKMTLDINQRIQLILDIDGEFGCYTKYDLSGSGLFENFSEIVKDVFLNRVDDLVRRYMPDETNDKYRKSIGLRLWSGCLSAAKTIALETRDGQNTPDDRTKTFQKLDHIEY
jgi:hypothetical protein